MPRAIETSEMCWVLKSLTDNKPQKNTRIIADNGRACVSQHQKANAFKNMYKSVSTLKLTKEDRGELPIPNRTLRTLEVINGTWPGFTTSEVRADPPNSIHQRLWEKAKLIEDSFITWAPSWFSFYDSFQQMPGVEIHPTGLAGH